MSLTFVTAFLDLYEERSRDKAIERCITLFKHTLASNVPIVAFLSPKYIPLLGESVTLPHLTIIPFELSDSWTYKEVQQHMPALPDVRTEHHDTLNFLTIMHAKSEFVHRAIERNPYNTTHFAWIDFSIFHVIRNIPNGIEQLKLIGNSRLRDTLLMFPGCWSKGYGMDRVWNAVNWRFCGGFFIGDAASLEHMHALYREHFPHTLGTIKRIAWEVNFWAYLENDCGWSPSWYKADHNDSIIQIPGTCYSVHASLTTIPSRIGGDCKLAIDSLLGQVDKIYLCVSSHYSRFNSGITIPDFYRHEPYASKVVIVETGDHGPATKYRGPVEAAGPCQWLFVCDDDQEYAPNLVERMLSAVKGLGFYQNRHSIISNATSGGLVHGYVGNLVHTRLLQDLATFPLPDCARHVDDQWMSIYCYCKGIRIFPTRIEEYSDIFKVLEHGREKWSIDALASLGTRDGKVAELARMFNITFLPKGNVLQLLSTHSNVQQGSYFFAPLDRFHPTSSSFLMHEDTPYLNVRYVNYILTPEGRYIINNPNGWLETENRFCTLSKNLSHISSGVFMKNKVELPTHTNIINGLEDIRLYDFKGRMRFIATQRQYSTDNVNRMMIGYVDISNNAYTNCTLVQPPTWTGCEKNWIPVPWGDVEQFIYKWYPYQIGQIGDHNTLVITKEKHMPSFFERVRGSTICDTNLNDGRAICVVHWSEETTPRTYTHALVEIDRTTCLPIRYSQPFAFRRVGIEFCIGFCFEPTAHDRVRFWFSQHDRDPMWLSVPFESFRWTTIT